MPSILKNILKEIEEREEYSGQKTSLCYCLVAGERISELICEKAKQLLGFYPREIYAMTEINGLAAIALDTPRSGKFQPIGDKKFRITNDNWEDLPFNTCGEITIWSTTIMTGYLNDENTTRQILKDGWMKTGDLGILENVNGTDIYLTYIGRKKLIIKCDGFNVNLLELEDTIRDNKAVFEVCVTGIPSQISGEKPVAYVSLRSKLQDEKNQDIIIQDIFSYLKEKVAAYKVPLYIQILDSLPKTVTGKIDRNALAQRALKEFAK
jgi:long-chain acyl-CoA synthetase